jgi:hypothetical protein
MTREGADGLVIDATPQNAKGHFGLSGNFGIFVDMLDNSNQPNMFGVQSIVDLSNIKVVNGFDASVVTRKGDRWYAKNEMVTGESVRTKTLRLYQDGVDETRIGNGELFSADAVGGEIKARGLTVYLPYFSNLNTELPLEFAKDKKLAGRDFKANGLYAGIFGVSGIKGWKEWKGGQIFDEIKGGIIERGSDFTREQTGEIQAGQGLGA